MAAINQENVNQLVSHINGANESFGSKLTSGVTTFADKIQEIWESEKAQQFATALEEAIDKIGQSYKQNVSSIVQALQTNVQNYNQFNGSNITTPTVDDLTYDISALGNIQTKFADGFVGLRDGHTVSEAVQYFDQMKTQIETDLTTAATSIRESNAFDNSEEQNAVASAFDHIESLLNNSMEDLKGELQNALTEVDDSAASLTNTNMSNAGTGE